MLYRRSIEPYLKRHLDRGKSILLLGPRQTGKTTLIGGMAPDLGLSLVDPAVRQRYEKDPSLLSGEIRALPRPASGRRRPLVTVDEVQKVPALMDVAQDLIDRGEAQFVFTGSSARKLRRGRDLNLLPGRLVALRLDPLTIEEDRPGSLQEALLFGSLPAIRRLRNREDREADLRSYVEIYLEEEVRQEALVRNVGLFGRFVELAGQESGRIANYTKISQEVGVSAVSIRTYYEILCDCLVAERVDPVTASASRKKLTKASRYLLFDLGVRRLAAGEGRRLHPSRLGDLFEQFVGLELIRLCRIHAPGARLRFWRDPGGPEVDWILEHEGSYLPIEVKLTDRPTGRDARHVMVFLKEHRMKQGFVICTAPRPVRLSAHVTAMPWHELPEVVSTMTRGRR
jgi:predicted AAA+ superfamily ATPase